MATSKIMQNMHGLSPKLRRIDWSLIALFSMIAVYAAFFSFFMLLKHKAFMTYMLDLGAYAQNLWGILNIGATPMHYSLIMYPLAMLYSVHSYPEVLLMLKSVIVPAGALPLYKLAMSKLENKAAALAVSALYLVYPPLHGISQFDFHLEDFLPLLFIALAYFYEATKPKTYLSVLAFCLVTMEAAPFIVLFFGLWLMLRNVRFGFNTTRFSLTFKWEVQTKLALATVSLSIIALLAYEAVAGWSIAGGFINASSYTFGLNLRDKAIYLSLIYGPLAFLPLTSMSQLAALPWLAFAFTSTSREPLQIYNQYPAFVTPFVFIGVIYALTRFSVDKKCLAWLLALLATSSAVYFSYSDPVFTNPYTAHFSSWPVITRKAERLNQIIALIPPDASVLTQNNIAPHLVNRKELYITLKDNNTLPQFILVDKSHFSFDEPNIRPSPAQLLPTLLENGDYGLRAVYESVELYQLGYSGEALRLKD